MNFKDLEYILAISREKSITKAAKSLGLSQPAVSRCLSGLEKELGIPLFEKGAGECFPTAAGQLFLSFADDVQNRTREFERDLRELLQYKQGHLRVGITPARSRGLTPEVFPEFRKNFPDIKIELFEDNVENLEHSLRKGQLDVAYFTVDEQYQQRMPEFHVRVLGEEEIVLTVKKGTELKQEPVWKYGFSYPWIDLSEFAHETFLSLKPDMRIGQIGDRVLKEHHLAPEVVRLSDMKTVHRLVIKGYGVCLCGSLGIGAYQDVLDIYSFGKERIRWKFAEVCRVGSCVTEPQQYLTELYKKAADAVRQDYQW